MMCDTLSNKQHERETSERLQTVWIGSRNVEATKQQTSNEAGIRLHTGVQ
jgi:hypothetical protein